MPYIVKQTLKLEDLVAREKNVATVLLHEPEECLRDLYSLYLSRHAFVVRHCLKPDELFSAIDFLRPQVVVVSLQAQSPSAITSSFVRSLRKLFPSLPVVTIGHSESPEHLKQLILAGVTSHIERRLSRPQDLATIIRTLLQN